MAGTQHVAGTSSRPVAGGVLAGAGNEEAGAGSAQQQVIAPEGQHFIPHTGGTSFRAGTDADTTCAIRKKAKAVNLIQGRFMLGDYDGLCVRRNGLPRAKRLKFTTEAAVCWQLFLPGRFHLSRKFGGIFVEVLQAGLAAQIHVGAVVGDFDRLAHSTEVFIGDGAFFEGIGGRNAFNGGDDASTEDQAGKEDESEFHDGCSCRFLGRDCLNCDRVVGCNASQRPTPPDFSIFQRFGAKASFKACRAR